MLTRLITHTIFIQTICYALSSILLLILSLFLGIYVYDSYETRIPSHWQRVWLPSPSNLTDQYDVVFTQPENSSQKNEIRIKALFIYPIKSCKPIEVDKAFLTKSGFAYDRCFCFAAEVPDVDDKTISKWRFITQRTKPQMSQIDIQLWVPSTEEILQDPLTHASGGLIVRFPDPDKPTLIARARSFLNTGNLSAVSQVRFFVPLLPTAVDIKRYDVDLKDFVIHDRTARGLDMGKLPGVKAAFPKLHAFLRLPANQKITLMRCTSDTATHTKDNLAPLQYIGQPAVLGYADEQPLSINSLSSDHALSELLPLENQPLDALRFRSNVYTYGSPAYDEERWKRFQIVPIGRKNNSKTNPRISPLLSVVCRTGRCTMPNVDPHTGMVTRADPPPGKTKGKVQPGTSLVEYRADVDSCPTALGYMGMHCVPEASSLKEAADHQTVLWVKVGDKIQVLETGEHRFAATADLYDVGRWTF